MDRIADNWAELCILARGKGVSFVEIDRASGADNVSKTLFFLGAAAAVGIFTEARNEGESLDDVTVDLLAELDAFLAPGGEIENGTLQ